MSKFLKCFTYAFRGILVGFNGRNFKIHTFMAIFVILAGIFYQLNSTEWFLVIFAIASVLSAELVNTAIEEICNLLKDKLHLKYPETRDIRDLAAGAVFLIALAALVVGLFIFVPKVFWL